MGRCRPFEKMSPAAPDQRDLEPVSTEPTKPRRHSGGQKGRRRHRPRTGDEVADPAGSHASAWRPPMNSADRAARGRGRGRTQDDRVTGGREGPTARLQWCNGKFHGRSDTPTTPAAPVRSGSCARRDEKVAASTPALRVLAGILKYSASSSTSVGSATAGCPWFQVSARASSTRRTRDRGDDLPHQRARSKDERRPRGGQAAGRPDGSRRHGRPGTATVAKFTDDGAGRLSRAASAAAQPPSI